MQKTTWVKLILGAILTTAIGMGMYLQWRPMAGSGGSLAGWGTGKLTASEKAYYQKRINAMIADWQQSRRDNERDKNGQFKDSYTTYLVIDTAEKAMWIEEDGRIREDYRTDLPSQMKWTLYRSGPQGAKALPGRARFKIRGYSSSRAYPEKFYFAGTGRGMGNISFNFSAGGRGSGSSSSSSFTPPRSAFSAKKAEDSYRSLIVTEGEYEEFRRSLTDSDPNTQTTGKRKQSRLDENKAKWRKIEKFLYRRIEKEITNAGFELRSIDADPGPDYSAAHATVTATSSGMLRSMFGGYYWGDIYVQIDHLGNDIWYARTAAHPTSSKMIMSRQGQLKLEFLVCPAGDVPTAQRRELMAKGRKIQSPTASARPSKYKKSLANGATVEFIGVCEHPSAGKKWWGPDGSELGYAPYLNAETYSEPPKGTKMYEMAWKVEFPRMPGGTSGGGTTYNLEGSKSSYRRPICDRYGNRIDNLHAQACAFEKSRKKTTLKIGVKVGKGNEYENVRFENISLVPGQNSGFKIVLPSKANEEEKLD